MLRRDALPLGPPGPRSSSELGRVDGAIQRSVLSNLQRQYGNAFVRRLLADPPAAAPSHRGLSLGRVLSPSVQRFVGTEHEELGDVTGVRDIDLGGGVVLSWGQIVALAGDYYGTIEELQRDASSREGRARIRAALEHYGSPRLAATRLPAPTEERRTEMLGRYALLALENIPHFVAGGTALENWAKHHARAIDEAIRAGLADDESGRNRAYAFEAFGQHFLTDAFSAGHVRTPRQEIAEWYIGELAPAVFDHFVAHLRDRLVNAIYDQLPWYVFFRRGHARRRIRAALEAQLATAIEAGGGREKVIRWFGLLVGGAVSGAIHDIEGARGVAVTSLAHPEPWHLVGDARLAESRETRAEAEQAILAAKQDVDDAYLIGLLESISARMVPEPSSLPNQIYFGFNRDDLSVEAMMALLDAASYLTYHPEASLELVGHTDPVGRGAYNLDLGLRRARAAAGFLGREGVEAARLTTESKGEGELVSTRRSDYWRNRRVELRWRFGDGTDGRDVPLERASRRALAEIGPPYARVTRFFPTPAAGRNLPIPEWRWGRIPAELRAEISRYVVEQARPLVATVLARPELDPREVEGYRIEPRPIAQAIINDLLADPVRFMERGFGRPAGPR